MKSKIYRIYDDVNYDDFSLSDIRSMILSGDIKWIKKNNRSLYIFSTKKQLDKDLDSLGYCFWNSSEEREEVNKIKYLPKNKIDLANALYSLKKEQNNER